MVAILVGEKVMYVYNYAQAQVFDKLPGADFYLPLENDVTQHLIKETMWGKYLMNVLATWNTDYLIYTPIALQVAHTSLGIVGEIAEILELSAEDEWLSEIGDLLYYRTMLCYLYGVDLEMRTNHKGITPDKCINLISDVGKKAGFFGKMYANKTLNRLEEGLDVLDAFILGVCEQTNYQIDEVMQFNVAKLRERHNNGKFDASYVK